MGESLDEGRIEWLLPVFLEEKKMLEIESSEG